MIERLSHQSVCFVHQFSLSGVDGSFPAGTYDVEVTEEQLEGVSFVAYRRVSTTIVLPGAGFANRSRQVVSIDPVDLEAALVRDAETLNGKSKI